MVSMTVAEFISALGSSVKYITYDTTQSEGVTLSDDGLTANVYNVAISGAFASSSTDIGLYFPATLVTADLRGLDTSGITAMSYMFCECSALESVDLSSFNTKNVKTTAGMFYGCKALKNIDLSNFDTSSVTNMSYMFEYCAMETLDLSGFDTSNVTTLSYMFFGCSSLKKLNLYSFGTSKVLSNTKMFYSCSETAICINPSIWTLGTSSTLGGGSGLVFITSVSMTVSELTSALGSIVKHITYDTSKGYGVILSSDGLTANINGVVLSGEFLSSDHFPISLVTADLRGLDTSDVTSMAYMFYGCSELETLDVSSFDTASVEDMACMFSRCSALTALDLSNFDTKSVTDMNNMFYNCKALSTLDLSEFDPAIVEDMSSMFEGCSSLTALDLSSFDTAVNVTTVKSMFYGCSSLKTLDLSTFYTPSVTTMASMFNGCHALSKLDLSSFGTSEVTTMANMFANCEALTKLDLSSFGTAKVTDMSLMFYNCSKLASVDISSFNTASVKTMKAMFDGCSAITALDLFTFDTSNVADMSYMFRGCSALKTLNLSSFETLSVEDMSDMFKGCEGVTISIAEGNWTLGTESTLGGGTKLNFENNDRFLVSVKFLRENLERYDAIVKKSISSVKSIFDIMYPVGVTYVQYPQQSSPNDLWGEFSTWEAIDYDGAFFRASGGNANAFIEKTGDLSKQRQSTAKNGLSASFSGVKKTGLITFGNNSAIYAEGVFSVSGSGKLSKSETSATGYTYVNFSITPEGSVTINGDSETRPDNFTIRIWKRTA